jgi:hypothetical protein
MLFLGFPPNPKEATDMSRSSLPTRRGAKVRRLPRLLAIGVSSAFAALAGSSALAVAEAAPTSPPPVTVFTSSPNNDHEDIFISPFGDASTYANGPEILDSHGNAVWFQAVPAGQEAADFHAQTYDGQPVLTWWQGTGLGVSPMERTTSTTTSTSRSRPSTPVTDSAPTDTSF